MIQIHPSFRRWLAGMPMDRFGISRLAGADGTAVDLVDWAIPAIAARDFRAFPTPLASPVSPAPTVTEDARRVAISVVIPHLNEPDRLERCLRSIDRQRGGRVAFEVIVVDNGSREPVAGICRAFSGVRHVVEPVPGPGPARNRGAALARGRILAFIDADCVAQQGWVEAIAEAFQDPRVDVLGGDIRILPRSARRTALEAYEGLYSYRARLFVERHGYAATGNMAVRTEVFRRVGPFPGLGTHEDVVWGRKARARGCTIVLGPASPSPPMPAIPSRSWRSASTVSSCTAETTPGPEDKLRWMPQDGPRARLSALRDRPDPDERPAEQRRGAPRGLCPARAHTAAPGEADGGALARRQRRGTHSDLEQGMRWRTSCRPVSAAESRLAAGPSNGSPFSSVW